jgi:RNA polymerase sigma-70 factor (ECF subfamily)
MTDEAMAARASAAEIPSGEGDERRLIEAAQADPQRFGALYERHFDRVYAFVARRSGSRGDAEDLTAEVFHQALANLGRFEWRGVPFVAWLLQIARNAVADRWQRLARERGEAPVLDEPGDPADADRRAVLADLVARLPREQQRVVLARFVEQRSVREIAEALGRTEGAVKQLQFRALESLRARMRDPHE